MQKDAISQVLEFAAEHPVLGKAMRDAADEFFAIPEDFEGDPDFAVEDMATFSEWFTFDYRFPDGRTLLAHYLDLNLGNLSKEDTRIYESLETNEYGLWEVVDVNIGSGLTLRNVQSGKAYEVKERSATFELNKGNFISTRIARVDDRWEIVSATANRLASRLLAGARRHFQEMTGKLSLRESWLISKARASYMPEPEIISLDRARRDLAFALKKHDLDRFVTADRVEAWLIPSKDRNSSVPLSLLLGLVEEGDFRETTDDMIGAVQNLANALPLEKFGGKSPNEKMAEPHTPDVSINVIPLGNTGWADAYNEGLRLLGEKPKQSLRAFQKSFRHMLEGKTTSSDLFRMYANLAISYFATGNEENGKWAVGVSLELCPGYDFGNLVKDRYKQGGYDSLIEHGALSELQKALTTGFIGKPRSPRKKRLLPRLREEKNYARLYYDFLKPFGIDFSSLPSLETSVITFDTLGNRAKIGRNDLCPCDSGKKWKKCHGKP